MERSPRCLLFHPSTQARKVEFQSFEMGYQSRLMMIFFLVSEVEAIALQVMENSQVYDIDTKA